MTLVAPDAPVLRSPAGATAPAIHVLVRCRLPTAEGVSRAVADVAAAELPLLEVTPRGAHGWRCVFGPTGATRPADVIGLLMRLRTAGIPVAEVDAGSQRSLAASGSAA